MKYLSICHCLGKVSVSAWLWAEGVDWWRKISWTSFHPHIRESSAQSCVPNTEKNVSCEKVELWRVLEHTELESWGWDHCDTYTWYTGEHWREETKTWARTTSVESWETLEKLVLTSVQMTRGLLWETIEAINNTHSTPISWWSWFAKLLTRVLVFCSLNRRSGQIVLNQEYCAHTDH